MHFLIVELKLHADAAATGGFFLSTAFFKTVQILIAMASKDPRCAPAPQSAERP